jgi:hypothetical protein
MCASHRSEPVSALASTVLYKSSLVRVLMICGSPVLEGDWEGKLDG